MDWHKRNKRECHHVCNANTCINKNNNNKARMITWESCNIPQQQCTGKLQNKRGHGRLQVHEREILTYHCYTNRQIKIATAIILSCHICNPQDAIMNKDHSPSCGPPFSGRVLGTPKTSPSGLSFRASRRQCLCLLSDAIIQH